MDNLIYDRTQADVDRAIELNSKYNNGTITEEELVEWNNFLKGAIDYKTLNRVGEWVQFLSNKLNSYQYINSTNPKTDWSDSNFMTPQQAITYLQNVRALMNAIQSGTTSQLPDSMNKLTYEGANAIEKIIDDINTAVIQLQNNFIRSGVSRLGQNRLWQVRFRHKQGTWSNLKGTVADNGNLKWNQATYINNNLGGYPITSRDNMWSTINLWNYFFETLDNYF